MFKITKWSIECYCLKYLSYNIIINVVRRATHTPVVGAPDVKG